MNNFKNPNSILLGQISTEKAVLLADKFRSITFRVLFNANKYNIKYAVEKIFNVSVISINTINIKGKTVKFKSFFGKKKKWKKAIVTLKKGYDINFSEFK